MSAFFVRASLVFLGCLIAAFLVLDHLLSGTAQNLPFYFLGVYVFHAVASITLCAMLILARMSPKFTDQVGYIYLISVAVKAILFFVIFREPIFSSHSLSNQEALAMLIPLFLGLFFEVFFVAKLLNKSPKIKNE